MNDTPQNPEEFANAVLAAFVQSPDLDPPAVVVVDPRRAYALQVASMIFDSDEEPQERTVVKFVDSHPLQTDRFYAFAGWMDRLQDAHCGDLPAVIRWAMAKAAPAPGWNPLVLCLPTSSSMPAMAALVVEPSRIQLK